MTGTAPSSCCDVLIIGAGLAGLTAARALRAAGRRVLVLEKSRGLGGRAATRRWEGWPVDHGAQFFTARSPEFTAEVGDWLARGVCFEWSRGLHRASAQGPRPPDGDNFPRYACREGISSLGRALAGPDPSFVLRQAKVVSVRRQQTLWEVHAEDGRNFQSPALIMTPPPPQSAALLATAAPEAATGLSALDMAPCLALAARYPRRDLTWRGLQAPEHPEISWIGHDTSKRPDLHPDATILVIHASAAFSREHFGAAEDALVARMLEAAGRIAGEDLSAPSSFFLQRWRYALGAEHNGPPAILSPGEPTLVLAGDAIAGGKIEGAWLSGREAARLLSAA
jgi:renalase